MSALIGVTEGIGGFDEVDIRDAGEAPIVSANENAGEESIAENVT